MNKHFEDVLEYIRACRESLGNKSVESKTEIE